MKMEKTEKGIVVTTEADGIFLGASYVLTTGWFKGSVLTVTYIHGSKNVRMDGGIFRSCSGILANGVTKINSVTEHLIEIGDFYAKGLEGRSYREASNVEIIRLAKLKDKEALREFVRRFKKLPQSLKS